MLAGALVLMSACGGGTSVPEAVSPTQPTTAAAYRWPFAATVILAPGGPEPAVITINVGGRVTFVNADTRPREIVSDPYLRHEDCPPLNHVGFLLPGERRESRVFEAARTCGFHDHLEPSYVGRIDVRIE